MKKPEKTYTVDFNDFQNAYTEEAITMQQFISGLIDNFGFNKARKILEQNLETAMKEERKT